MDEAFKAAAAIEKERVDAVFNSAAIGLQAEQSRMNELLETFAATSSQSSLFRNSR